ncbi:DUF4405 domain-containing protein [Sporomusa acidovorans]|nr:DUF4405 domain-containing protein [Sporomusa acidovorans]
MNYRYIGNSSHEIGGVVLALLFILHNMLNWRWYGYFFKGKQSLRRILMNLTNLLLVVAMVTVFVTGVLISVTVFAPLGIRSSSLFMHELHQGSAYASFILAAVHLGFHWEMLVAKCKNWLHIDGASRGWIIMSRSVSIIVITYGIYASFVNQIGDNLLMQHNFAGWGAEISLRGFLLDYFAIMGCYVGITYYLLQVLNIKKQGGLY